MTTTLKTNGVLYCGAIAYPIFIFTVLIEGFLRKDYNSFKFPLSSLSIGETGWIQIVNFILAGILILIFSFGLKQKFNIGYEKFRGPLLIRLVGLGLIGAGIFVTDPIYGYPINKPLVLWQYSFHGHLHDGFSMFVFICMPWVCFVFSKYFKLKGLKRWSYYSAFTAYAMIVSFILTSIGFKQITGFVNYAGLFQRICISIGGVWMTLLSIYFLKFESDQHKVRATGK